MEEESQNCIFYNICADWIMEERIGNKRWRKRFCFGKNPGSCIYFEEGFKKQKIDDEFRKSPAA